MFSLFILVVILTTTLCTDKYELNSFKLLGLYDIFYSCDVYLCPNTRFLN